METIGTVGIVALFIFGALIAIGMIISFLGFIIQEGGDSRTESRSGRNTFSVQIPAGSQSRGYIEYQNTGTLPDYLAQSCQPYQISHEKERR